MWPLSTRLHFSFGKWNWNASSHHVVNAFGLFWCFTPGLWVLHKCFDLLPHFTSCAFQSQTCCGRVVPVQVWVLERLLVLYLSVFSMEMWPIIGVLYIYCCFAGMTGRGIMMDYCASSHMKRVSAKLSCFKRRKKKTLKPFCCNDPLWYNSFFWADNWHSFVFGCVAYINSVVKAWPTPFSDIYNGEGGPLCQRGNEVRWHLTHVWSLSVVRPQTGF